VTAEQRRTAVRLAQETALQAGARLSERRASRSPRRPGRTHGSEPWAVDGTSGSVTHHDASSGYIDTYQWTPVPGDMGCAERSDRETRERFCGGSSRTRGLKNLERHAEGSTPGRPGDRAWKHAARTLRVECSDYSGTSVTTFTITRDRLTGETTWRSVHGGRWSTVKLQATRAQ
jgi:hypothetical protein